LLDNRVHHGIAGFFVITPLRLSSSDVRVMVNRGWLPWGETRDPLPTIEMPQGMQKITGIATVPSEQTFTLGEPGPLRKSQPSLWPYLNFERFRKEVPFPVQPVVVLLSPESDAGGFTREWSRLEAGIAVHQGYAFQWFALAAGMLFIFILLSRRTKVPRDNADHTQNSDI
jgi:surfeit locus 1 family protein